VSKEPFITIIGNYGSTNLGDEALLESLLQQLRSHKDTSNATIHVMSSNPKETTRRYKEYKVATSVLFPFGFRTFFARIIPYFKSLKLLKQSDMVIVGGGGLFVDHQGSFPCWLWGAQLFVLHTILRKKVLLLGQSFSTHRTFFGKWITKAILKGAEEISVRDDISRKVAEKLTTKKIFQGGDLAFYLDSHQQKQSSKEPHQDKALHVALSLRPWPGTSLLLKDLAAALTSFHESEAIHLHLLPMQTIKEGDHQVLQDLITLLPEELPHTLHTPQHYSEVEQILSQCHMAIGMRLHFMIFAIRMGLPYMALSYSNKVSGIAEHFSIPWISVNSSSKKELLHTMEEVRISKQDHQSVLKELTSSNQHMDLILEHLPAQ